MGIIQNAHSLAHKSVTPLSFHFDGGYVSELRLTLKMRYLSVLFAYLYTGQLYTDLSSPVFFLLMAVTWRSGKGENISLGLEASKEFLCHLAPSRYNYRIYTPSTSLSLP